MAALTGGLARVVATARQRVLYCVLDALGALEGARAWACLWIAVVFTVWCDPFRYSAAAIRVGGTSATFRVSWAPSERERRIVALFYRWHDAPDERDWRACVARFGLAGPPPHRLRPLCGGGDIAVEIRLPPGAGRAVRVLERGNSGLEDTAPIGGLTPGAILRTFG